MIMYLASIFVIGGVCLALYSIRPEPKMVSIGIDPEDVVPTSRELDLQGSVIERVLLPLLRGATARASRYMPAGIIDKTAKNLRVADMDRRWSAELIVAIQAVGGTLGAFGAYAYLGSAGASRTNLLMAAFMVLIPLMGPTAKINRTADDRRKQITNELPDVLDQLTVTVEAGMSFDGAVLRAGQEGRGLLAHELLKVVNDQQIGLSRGEALQAMAERTDVPDLRGFVTAVRQAEKHGFPLANILRLQSLELRDKRRARAEEKAMQVPVKITFPLVFCILPALFIVIIGPAMINITSSGGF